MTDRMIGVRDLIAVHEIRYEAVPTTHAPGGIRGWRLADMRHALGSALGARSSQ